MPEHQPDPPERGLSLRELVLDIRGDVKELRQEVKQELDGHHVRINLLENHTLILRGAWMSIGVTASVVAGTAGLLIGIYAIL